MRRVAWAALLLLLGAAPGCSMILVNNVPVRPDKALRLGADRAMLSEVLGPPRSTDAATLDHFVRRSAADASPAFRDVYVTSGLVQCPGDEYGGEWNVYPAFLIVTLGLIEIVTLPGVIYDLSVLSDECGELYAWYDRDGRLVAWGKRWLPGPCDADR